MRELTSSSCVVLRVLSDVFCAGTVLELFVVFIAKQCCIQGRDAFMFSELTFIDFTNIWPFSFAPVFVTFGMTL